jgi:hypothetical protein
LEPGPVDFPEFRATSSRRHQEGKFRPLDERSKKMCRFSVLSVFWRSFLTKAAVRFV